MKVRVHGFPEAKGQSAIFIFSDAADQKESFPGGESFIRTDWVKIPDELSITFTAKVTMCAIYRSTGSSKKLIFYNLFSTNLETISYTSETPKSMKFFCWNWNQRAAKAGDPHLGHCET